MLAYHAPECALCDSPDGHREGCPSQEPVDQDNCQECGANLWRGLGHLQSCSMMLYSERRMEPTVDPDPRPISDLEIRRRNAVLSLKGKINRWRAANWLPPLEGDSNASTQ